MTIRSGFTLPLLALTSALLASCTSSPAPRPSAPAPAPTPTPVPPPPRISDWRDLPVTAGNWSYRAVEGGSVALYGAPGQDALVSVRCDRARKTVYIARALSGTGGTSMRLHSSYGDVVWPASRSADAPPATQYAIASRSAQDRTLDQMAMSRGRFVLEVAGAPPIAVPAWPEPARVIEDCRE